MLHEHADYNNGIYYKKFWNTNIYFVYFKSKKVLNYNRFVDQNILGAVRLVHSDRRIYRISFFLLDIIQRCNGDMDLVHIENHACIYVAAHEINADFQKIFDY